MACSMNIQRRFSCSEVFRSHMHVYKAVASKQGSFNYDDCDESEPFRCFIVLCLYRIMCLFFSGSNFHQFDSLLRDTHSLLLCLKAKLTI